LVLTSGILTGTVSYTVEATAKSSVNFAIRIYPPTANTGKTGIIVATLLDTATNSPVTGMSITNTLKMQVGKTITTSNLILQDNGQGGDTTAGDGKYTATLPDNLAFDFIQIDAIATGTYKGQPFSRFASDISNVRSGEVRFDGNYKWQPYTSSTNGTSNDNNKITFEAGVIVQRKGVYRVEAVLLDATGHNISTASTTRSIDAGGATIQLMFDVEQILKDQFNGSLHIGALKAYIVEGDRSRDADTIDDTTNVPELVFSGNQINNNKISINGSLFDKKLVPLF
jgi:hypothetical protein